MYIMLVVSGMVSCATIPTLKVTYLLPTISDDLKGEKVFIVFRDNREIKDIMGEGAKEKFRHFAGNVYLSLAGEEDEGEPLGLFDLRSMFKEIFKRRLENLGMRVLQEKETGQLELLIILREFNLDLVKKRWVARMSYEARLESSGKILSGQTISGEAERLRIVGNTQADTVVSDLFTELVNKLDIEKLFRYESAE
jgi:hypothetical protein